LKQSDHDGIDTQQPVGSKKSGQKKFSAEIAK
jgi:hypothetical protein